MMLISEENRKEAASRDYLAAYEQYEAVGKKLRSSDDTSYYKQLESLIGSLKQNGWL